MATISPRWAWERAILASSLPPTTRHCLLTLATYVNMQGEAWPPIARLALDTGLSTRTIIEHLAVAISAGWVHKLKLGRSNRYLIDIPRGEGLSSSIDEARSPYRRAQGKQTGEAGAQMGEFRGKQRVKTTDRKPMIEGKNHSTTDQGNSPDTRDPPLTGNNEDICTMGAIDAWIKDYDSDHGAQ